MKHRYLDDSGNLCCCFLQMKQPRIFSASATRSRNRQKESTSSVWESAGGGTLQCTGVRAELVSRNGESGFSDDTLDAVDTEDWRAFADEADNRRRDGSHHLARKTELGRFQWVTNDEGVATFLQRPPSRQKEAFPTHLADVVPYAAFKVLFESKSVMQSVIEMSQPRLPSSALQHALLCSLQLAS